MKKQPHTRHSHYYHQHGEAYYKQEDYEKANNKYREGLALGDSLKDRSLIARNLIGLGDTYFAQKNYVEADRAYQQLLQLSNLNAMRTEELKAYRGAVYDSRHARRIQKAYEYYRSYVNIIEKYFYTREREQVGKQTDLEKDNSKSYSKRQKSWKKNKKEAVY